MRYILNDGIQDLEVPASSLEEAMEKVLSWNGMTIQEFE